MTDLEEAPYEGDKYFLLPTENEFEIDDYGDGFIGFTVTNDGDEILYPSCTVQVLYDRDDNLIYVECSEMNIMGIYPGTTVSLKAYIDRDFMNYYYNKGITPARSEVLVYVPEK